MPGALENLCLDRASILYCLCGPVRLDITFRSGKKFSGKFNLRTREALHERLVLESAKVGKNLNAFCAEALENAVTR